MPPPIGVVNGPLIAIKYSLIVSKVSCGNHSPVSSYAFDQLIPLSTQYAFHRYMLFQPPHQQHD